VTSFVVAVGGLAALTSLTTDAAGTSSSAGVSTTGANYVHDNTTLAGTYNNAGFTPVARRRLPERRRSMRGAAHQLRGHGRWCLLRCGHSSAATTFGGAVGGTTALASLTTDAAGSTAINGGSVRTSGAQTYNDAVTLGANSNLTCSTVTFARRWTMQRPTAHSLTVTGNAAFNGVVGTTALNSIHVTGTTADNTTAITTSGPRLMTTR